VALVRTDFSEERVVSIIRVARIGVLGTTIEITNNRSILRRNRSPILVTLVLEVIRSSETSVRTKATSRHVPEDGFLPPITIIDNRS
jgi:hypothetical protein